MVDQSVNVYAVLPAAGCGERMYVKCSGGRTPSRDQQLTSTISKPKQYCPVLGKPLICYAIEGYERIPWVKKVIVVASPDYLELMRSIVEDYGKCEVVTGGPTRHRSVAAGLKALSYAADSLDPQIVVVHDGVRPLVPVDIVRDVVIAAKQYGASGVVRSLVSTIISSDEDGFLDECLERSRYKASEMPQGFQYNVIKTAYEKCTEYDLDNGTECLHLAVKYAGVKAKLVEGTADLWKVTHRRDMVMADATLRESSNRILIVSDNIQSSLIETMQKVLDMRFSKADVCDFKIREPGDYAEYNNTVFVHFNRSVEELARSKEMVLGEAEKMPRESFESDDELQGVVVHVITYTKDPVPSLADFPDAYDSARRIADRHSNLVVSVHIVWNIVQMSDNDKKISGIVAELIHNRSASLHGQLMIV